MKERREIKGREEEDADEETRLTDWREPDEKNRISLSVLTRAQVHPCGRLAAAVSEAAPISEAQPP